MHECRLFEIDLSDTAILQLHNKPGITIRNLMKHNTSKFPNRDRHIEENNILYHINTDNKEYKAADVPKQHVS